jgi:hypothetical protein
MSHIPGRNAVDRRKQSPLPVYQWRQTWNTKSCIKASLFGPTLDNLWCNLYIFNRLTWNFQIHLIVDYYRLL